jgi:hypothetical protein
VRRRDAVAAQQLSDVFQNPMPRLFHEIILAEDLDPV